MKVKLLKKLRKLAHNKIYVIYDKSFQSPYIIYKKQYLKNPYYLRSYNTYDAAIIYCNSQRRIYIEKVYNKILKRKAKRVY